MSFELFIALRYLRCGRRQTALTVSGVAVGVFALVITIGMLEGWKEKLLDKTIGAAAHIEIYRDKPQSHLPPSRLRTLLLGRRGLLQDLRETRLQEHRQLRNYTELEDQLAGTAYVVATCPVVYTSAIARRGDRDVMLSVRGSDVGRYDAVAPFLKYVTAGDARTLGPDGVAIGYRLSEDLGVALHQKLVLLSPKGVTRHVTMRAVFRTGYYDADAKMVQTPLRMAQNLAQIGREATAVLVKLDDPQVADHIAAGIEASTGTDARSWMESNAEMLTALRLNDEMTYLIISLTLIVAAFGIASVLIMVVLEKAKEIGILQSMGATRRKIQRIFVLQGLVVGVLGGILGCLTGGLACLAIGRQKLDMPPSFSLGVEAEYWPMKMTWQSFLLCIVVAVVISFAASLVPAWRAGRLDPVEVIRRG